MNFFVPLKTALTMRVREVSRALFLPSDYGVQIIGQRSQYVHPQEPMFPSTHSVPFMATQPVSVDLHPPPSHCVTQGLHGTCVTFIIRFLSPSVCLYMFV